MPGPSPTHRPDSLRTSPARRHLTTLALVSVANPLQLPAQQPAAAASSPVFLEIHIDDRRPYRQQAIRLRLRLGVEQGFAREGLIQLFRTPLELPVQLEAPWLDQLSGTRALPRHPASSGIRIAVNQTAELARRLPDQVRGDRKFTILEVERRYLAERLGSISIPAAALRFAHATRYRDDLLHGRVALDRRESRIQAAGITLEVRPLPAAGRPATFSGAVGRFRLTATTSSRQLRIGEQFQLSVRIEGEGELGAFTFPSLAEHPGLHVLGKVRQEHPGALAEIYDIKVVNAAARTIPAVVFDYFEAGPGLAGRYHRLRTTPIDLQITGTPDPTGPTEAAPRRPSGGADIFDLKPSLSAPTTDPTRVPVGWLGLLLLSSIPWLLGLGLRTALRLRRRATDPVRRRARLAYAEFRRHAAADDAMLADALVNYLAARLDCAAATIVAHDLDRRLRDAGIPAQLARSAAALVEQLLADRYGGVTESSHDEVLDLVAELEAHLQS